MTTETKIQKAQTLDNLVKEAKNMKKMNVYNSDNCIYVTLNRALSEHEAHKLAAETAKDLYQNKKHEVVIRSNGAVFSRHSSQADFLGAVNKSNEIIIEFNKENFFSKYFAEHYARFLEDTLNSYHSARN